MNSDILYLLEGPDGGGKSTLAERLVTKVTSHGPYLDLSQIAPIYAEDMLSSAPLPRALDRCWLSELVYAPLVRDERPRVSVPERRWLERIALGRNAVIVYCLPETVEVCLEATRGRSEYAPLSARRSIFNLYHELWEAERLPCVRYLWDANLEVRDQARALRSACHDVVYRNRGWGWGAWRPGHSVLLVGDRPSTPRGPDWVPLVDFAGTGCSAWLAHQLEEADVPEVDLYWVNAFQWTGRPNDLRSLPLHQLRPRAVCALGTAAYTACVDAGLRDFGLTRFDHPQYHKRFQHHKAYPLVDALVDLTRGEPR